MRAQEARCGTATRAHLIDKRLTRLEDTEDCESANKGQLVQGSLRMLSFDLPHSGNAYL